MTDANNLQTLEGQSPPPSQPPVDPPRRHWLRRWWWAVSLATVSSVITAVVVAGMLIHVPYVIESPGGLYQTTDRISITGVTPYPTNDRIELVTVSVDTRVTALEKFFAEHNGDDIIEPAKDVLGDQTPAQNDELNRLLMKQSKDDAVQAALLKLGYPPPTSTGALVVKVESSAPAAGKINEADTIVAVDDKPITSRDDLTNTLGTYKPDDTTTVGLEGSDGSKRSVQVTLGDNPQRRGVGYLGVSIQSRLVYPDLPVQVTVNSGDIGGPSAGLAFTLGILDLMTPGDLTGGREVAVTGTIDSAGNVGEIGGIETKVLTVARGGVKYFLVPATNAAAAQAKAPKGLQIVPVHTLDEALAFLASLGGSGLPAAAAAPGQ